MKSFRRHPSDKLLYNSLLCVQVHGIVICFLIKYISSSLIEAVPLPSIPAAGPSAAVVTSLVQTAGDFSCCIDC